MPFMNLKGPIVKNISNRFRKRLQCSNIGMLSKRYHFAMEDISKGYLSCHKWYLKVGGCTSEWSLQVNKFVQCTPPPPSPIEQAPGGFKGNHLQL